MKKRKILEFFSSLELGDLGLSRLIKFGFILYGMTRIGKTATSHLLSGNALKGQKGKGNDILDVATTKFKKAKIGH